jgi:hypothetical protein
VSFPKLERANLTHIDNEIVRIHLIPNFERRCTNSRGINWCPSNVWRQAKLAVDIDRILNEYERGEYNVVKEILKKRKLLNVHE